MTRRERDLRAQQVAAGALQFIQRPGLCHGQQAERGVEGASPVLGLRGGQRPLRAKRRVERQPGGPLQERSRRRETTAAPCPACGLLKFGSDFLIWARRGLGPVPGPPIRIDSRVGDLGQRAVQLLPRLDRCRPVGRRAHQRMPEPHPREALLDPPVQRYRAADPEPARQLRRRQPSRQLKQRQRVPVRVAVSLSRGTEPGNQAPGRASTGAARTADQAKRSLAL